LLVFRITVTRAVTAPFWACETRLASVNAVSSSVVSSFDRQRRRLKTAPPSSG
jgi:hypothetical protein